MSQYVNFSNSAKSGLISELGIEYIADIEESQVHIVVEIGHFRVTNGPIIAPNITSVDLFIPTGEHPPRQINFHLSRIQVVQLSDLASQFDYSHFVIAIKDHLAQTQVSRESCSICLEGHTCQQVAVQLLCAHIFHSNCITEWFRRNHQCPLCRFDIE